MTRTLVIACCAAAVVAGCQRNEGRETPHAAPAGTASAPVPDSLGGVIPGIHPQVAFGSLHNPYQGNVQAERNGRQLFLSYNCVGMPRRARGRRDGSEPARQRVERTGTATPICSRPSPKAGQAACPTWGNKIPEDQIWKLVSYIRTLRTKEEPDPPPPATQPNRMKLRDAVSCSCAAREVRASRLLTIAALACAGAPSPMLPASEPASQLAHLGWLLTFVAAIVCVAIAVLLLVPGIRGWRAGSAIDPTSVHRGGGERWIVVGGIIVPIVILLGVFAR